MPSFPMRQSRFTHSGGFYLVGQVLPVLLAWSIVPRKNDFLQTFPNATSIMASQPTPM